MPKIPIYEPHELIPASSGLVRVNVADAGAPGRALMQEGQALQGVAASFGEIAGKLKRQEDASATSRAAEELEEFSRTVQYGSTTAGTAGSVGVANPLEPKYLGALAAEGEAAFGMYEGVKKSLDGKISEISSRLANDDQRRAFEERARIATRSVLNSVSRHEAQERAKVVGQTADTDLQRTLRLASESADDSEAVGELTRTHIETLKQLFPERPDLYANHYTRILASQAEGMAGKNPARAHEMADALKDMVPFETLKKLKQGIDVKTVQTEAMLDPGGTMMKLSSVSDDGVYTYYRTLDINQRMTLVSSIYTQLQHQQAVLKQQKETAQEELKSQVYDLVAAGKVTDAEQHITQWSRERKIDFRTAKELSEFLRADSKVSDPAVKLDTWDRVLFGKISSREIKDLAVQGDLSVDDSISMMKKKKEISQNAAQSAALRSLSSRTVIDEARKIIDPGGVLSTPEAKVQMMRFSADFEKASKAGGFDPVEFWNENGWKYTQNSVPSLWDGSRPKTVDDVTAAKQRLTRSGLPVSKQNVEAEKLRQAEKVLRETERIRSNARNRNAR